MKERFMVLNEFNDLEAGPFNNEAEAVEAAKLEARDNKTAFRVVEIIGEAKPTTPPIMYTTLRSKPRKRK